MSVVKILGKSLRQKGMDFTGENIVLRRRIGENWHEHQDADYIVVHYGDSFEDCVKWMEDDLADMIDKWPELYSQMGKILRSGTVHDKTVVAFVGGPDFAVDYQVFAPGQSVIN